MYCMGVSASETHSQKNTGMSVEEATGRIIATAKQAMAAGTKVQVSVQSAFGCGFEGPVKPEKVLGIVARYLEAGLSTISLADTAGHAYPEQVAALFEGITKLDPSADLACHFHNTYGLGLANCHVAMQMGVRSLESAFGGLGGCPFTKQPAGNVCTDDLVHWLQRTGRRSDIDLATLIALSKDVAAFFGRDLPGLVYKSGPVPTGPRA
jgi:hydroxymethylglutaryl-CoA lyase